MTLKYSFYCAKLVLLGSSVPGKHYLGTHFDLLLGFWVLFLMSKVYFLYWCESLSDFVVSDLL